MEVTFDPTKNEGNLKKHGISLQRTEDFDFLTAFYDADHSRDYGEARYNAIGWLDALLHTLTFTQDGEVIRAISLRRATRQEQMTYAEET
jgi:uncharacterized DUF497 family protein